MCTAPDQDGVLEFPKHINESPADRVAIGVTCVDVEVRIVDPVIRVVNIDWLGSDVQIAEPNGRHRRVEPLAEIPAHAVKPLQLVDVLIGADFVSLRNIGINDGQTIDHSFEDTDIFAVRSRAETIERGLGLATGQSGNAVVALHAAERDVVSGIAESDGGKVAVGHLGFLEAEHIGFIRRQPVNDERQSPTDRVDVPGRNSHRPF